VEFSATFFFFFLLGWIFGRDIDSEDMIEG
jgi:hypothetical protein